MVEWIPFYHIWEIVDSNFNLEISYSLEWMPLYHNWEILDSDFKLEVNYTDRLFMLFPFPQENSVILPKIRLDQFPIQYSPVIL
jgi:hypothetical protein